MIEQQQKIVEEIKKYENRDEKEVIGDRKDDISFSTSDKCDAKNDHKSQIPDNNNVSAKSKAKSLMDVSNDLTRSSSSSMQTLRRIMEIEECRRFSDILDLRVLKMFSVSN